VSTGMFDKIPNVWQMFYFKKIAKILKL